MTVLRIVPNLPARDPAALAAWYQRLFEINPVMDLGFIVTVESGQAQTPQVSMAREGGSGTDLPALSIEVDDLAGIMKRADGAVVYGPVDEPWGVRRIFLRDPEGNIVNVLCHL